MSVTRMNKGWSDKIKSMIDSRLTQILEDGMLHVEAESKRIVYLGHEQGHLNYLTGKLGMSITTESGWDSDGAYAVVGTNVDYAPTHEFGAVIQQKNRTVRIPARPYLIPAFETKKHEAVGIVRDELMELIKGV